KVETLEAENKDIKMNLENQLYIMNARLEKQAKRQDIIDAVMASPEMAEILRQTEERKKVLQT
ncbi:MAG: hypothetical protein KGN01_07455, partial [Patescibacteria group bacterium]|nr:hypothetical protein [Patescibacteria group bacterium]